MNREDIIRMAREAGGLPDPMVFIGAYERFAALVAAAEREESIKLWESLRFTDEQIADRIDAAVKAEREACAKVVESRKTGANELMDAVRDMEAAAIRARSNT